MARRRTADACLLMSESLRPQGSVDVDDMHRLRGLLPLSEIPASQPSLRLRACLARTFELGLLAVKMHEWVIT
eukprot:scaffold467877_cov18-Prasinocladus_malaysianus.AAC.1